MSTTPLSSSLQRCRDLSAILLTMAAECASPDEARVAAERLEVAVERHALIRNAKLNTKRMKTALFMQHQTIRFFVIL